MSFLPRIKYGINSSRNPVPVVIPASVVIPVKTGIQRNGNGFPRLRTSRAGKYGAGSVKHGMIGKAATSYTLHPPSIPPLARGDIEG